MRISDWSSDVCSSDLGRLGLHPHERGYAWFRKNWADAGERCRFAYEEAGHYRRTAPVRVFLCGPRTGLCEARTDLALCLRREAAQTGPRILSLRTGHREGYYNEDRKGGGRGKGV